MQESRAAGHQTNQLMVWYGWVWYGMVWYGNGMVGMVWNGGVWEDIVGIVWYENSMVGYGAAGHQTNQGVMA